MLTLHETHAPRCWFSSPLGLALACAVVLAMLALFAPQAEATSPPPTYTLSVTVVGTGCSVTKNPSASSYSSGTVVTLTAVPASGWLFDHWEWGLTGNANPTTITMSSDKMVRAVFVDSTYYTLMTAVSPAAGYVTPNWGSYAPASQVQISASANNGYRFGYWTGNPTFSSTNNPATVTMNSHQLVTANFIKTYTLTTNVVAVGGGTGCGSVDLNPSGGVYDTGTIVSMTAVAAPGWRFQMWSGDAIFFDNPETVTMTSNKNVTASFYRIYNLSTTVIGQGTVYPAAGTYPIGEEVSLTATPAANWRFKQWSGDASGTTSPVTVMMDANKAVTAEFVTDYTLSISTWREGSVDPGVGDHPYTSDQTVRVTATAETDTRFDHWEGDVPAGQNAQSAAIQVPMDQNRSLMAVFVRQMTLETSIIGQGGVSPASATVDQGDDVTLTASPDPNWAFRGWIGDIESSANPVTVTVDAPMHVVAEFVENGEATGLNLVSDLNALLTAAGESTAELAFDEGNGIPDAAEFMVLEAVLENAQYNRVPYGGTGHQTVYNAWVANLAQAEIDLASQSAAIQRAVAAYMTLGEEGHVAFASSAALEVASATLDTSLYSGGLRLGAQDDADGDTHWNRLEWIAVLEYYQVTTPTMTHAGVYVTWVLDPSLPTDENVDIGMDLPDGDGTDWDYSYLPQGTVTFQSAEDLPIEIRVLDPPGREDVPVPVGQLVQIPLGAELLVALAEGANPDWFYKWEAPGNMIHESAEATERFRLMRGGTIQPQRRPVETISLTADTDPENPYTWTWSGVGPFGNLVEEGSGSSLSAIEVPFGAFLKIKAQRTEEAPAGASANAGADVQSATSYDYELIGGIERTGYGASIAVDAKVVTDVEAKFGAAPALGLVTHTVSVNEGGYGCVGVEAGGGAQGPSGMAGLYAQAKSPRLPEGSSESYPVRFRAECFPGWEFETWTGDLAAANPTQAGDQYPAAAVAATATHPVVKESATMVEMLTLEVDVKVEGGGGTPAEAGHATAEEAKKWYSPAGQEYVQLDASAHVGFYFTHWSGDGVAYPDDGHGGANDQIELPLDNPDVPVTDPLIWIAMGDESGASIKTDTGRNSVSVR